MRLQTLYNAFKYMVPVSGGSSGQSVGLWDGQFRYFHLLDVPYAEGEAVLCWTETLP